MAVAIIGQAERDGGRGRDRKIKKREREKVGGRTGERSERKEEERKRERRCSSDSDRNSCLRNYPRLTGDTPLTAHSLFNHPFTILPGFLIIWSDVRGKKGFFQFLFKMNI